MKFNFFLFLYIIIFTLQLKCAQTANKQRQNSIPLKNEILNINKQSSNDKTLTNENLNDKIILNKVLNDKIKHVKIDFINPQNESLNGINIESNFLEMKNKKSNYKNLKNVYHREFKKNSTRHGKYSDKHSQLANHSKHNTSIFNETSENLNYLKVRETSDLKHLMKKNKDDVDIDDMQESESGNHDGNAINTGKTKIRTTKNTGFKGYCLIKFNNYILNLHLIALKENNFFIKSSDGVVDFNICHNVKSYDESKKGLVVNRIKNTLYAGNSHVEKFFMINFIDENQKDSLKMHSLKNNLKNNQSESNSNIQSNVNAEEKPLFKNIQIYLPQGDICTTNPINGKISRFTIMYELTCDPIADKAYIFNEYEFNPNACFNKIKIKTKYICPQFMKKFVSWYERFFINKYILALVILANGIFLMFFGRLYLKISMCCSITLLSYMIMGAENWIDGEANPLNMILLLLVPLICLIYYNNPSILYWICSMLLATTLGDMFFCLTGKFIVLNNVLDFEEYKLLVFTIHICLFIFLTCHYNHEIVYWETTFVGAYSFVRGISINYGKFPDRVFINLLIKYREFVQYDRAFEGIATYYLISISILWTGSFILQKFYLESFKAEMNLLLENDKKANQSKYNVNKNNIDKDIEKRQYLDESEENQNEAKPKEKRKEKNTNNNNRNERKSISNNCKNSNTQIKNNDDNVFYKEEMNENYNKKGITSDNNAEKNKGEDKGKIYNSKKSIKIGQNNSNSNLDINLKENNEGNGNYLSIKGKNIATGNENINKINNKELPSKDEIKLLSPLGKDNSDKGVFDFSNNDNKKSLVKK